MRKAFQADAKGNIGIMIAAAMPVLIGFSGIAIDYGRTVAYQRNLQKAADAAALAGVTLSRNGGTIEAANTVAQQILAANLGISSGSASAPTVQISQSGAQHKATVQVQGEVQTTLSRILGYTSLPATGSATATARPGPTGFMGVAQNYKGNGGVWGDPHFDYNSSTGSSISVIVFCNGGSWYNVLSDAGVQWNSMCATDGSNLIFAGTQFKIGTHTISYMPYLGAGNDTYGDSFADDNVDIITPSAIPTGWVLSGLARPVTLTVDGKVINPYASLLPGQTSFTVLSDPAQNIEITAQISNHPIPAGFGTTPSGVYNYQALDIKTARYEIGVMFQPYGPQYYELDVLGVSNGGMCGQPGGYYGTLMAGTPGADLAPFLIQDPTLQGPEFYWTPSCNNAGGTFAHLVE